MGTRLDAPSGTTEPRQPCDWLPGLVFSAVGLGRVELPTSRLSGVRSNPLSYRPSFAPLDRLPRPSLPFPLRSLFRPELVVLTLIELVVEVVVVVVFAVLIVELVLVQLIIEVFVELLVLFEFSELLVDLIAPPLERPVRRRLTGLHCHLRLGFESNDPPACPTPPAPRASRCEPACGARSRPRRACAAAETTASPRSARRPRYTPTPAPRRSGVAAPT